MFRKLNLPLQLLKPLFVSLLVLVVYFYGLGNEEIPKNGDEYVYAHITRLTAESGHLLPLQSELHQMRNTKPPLLFWQGMASTRGGESWTLWHLRWPNVVYSLMTALLAGVVAWRITRKAETAYLAGLIYLGFFSTYRFGRPFLTNAPEVFWLFVPFALLLIGGNKAFESRWRMPILLGVVIGMGLLYKSFAMLAPVGVVLACWYLHERRYQLVDFIKFDLPRLILLGLVALGLFGLWFVFDPDPASVWREFVVGENAQKFDPQGGSYFAKLFWGTSSLWSLALGFLQNAALLALPVLALFLVSWRGLHRLSTEEKRLWMWVGIFFLVFCIPSQRSARYLLDVMPAIAILCALVWDRLPRWAFVGTHLLVLIGTTFLLWIDLRLSAEMESGLGSWLWFLLLGLTAVLSLLGMFRHAFGKSSAPLLVLLVYLGMAGVISPLEGPSGHFKPEAVAEVQGRVVAVPYNFNAKFEIYRFVLPGAKIQGYHEDLAWNANDLAQKQFPFFVVELPMNEAAPSCHGCSVIDSRLKLRSRHTPTEIQAMLKGHIFEHLFFRDYLVRVDVTSETPYGYTSKTYN